MSAPTYVFGSHQIGDNSAEELEHILNVLKKNNVKIIDTARVYTDSEKRLGEIGASKSFAIDTKSPSFVPKALSRDSLTAGIDESLSSLKTNKVEIYYLHAPDAGTSIEETVDTIQELHRQGRFERFGLSNFVLEDVRKIHAYAASTGGIIPSVYQGHYNAFARTIEKDLFPLLRKLKMSFYAYSPLAGGFFAKDPEKLARNSEGGRFDASTLAGQMYNSLYNKPVVVEGLKQWRKLAEEVGETSESLAYRWVTFHSQLDPKKGDAVIIGARRPGQLERTFETLNAGPLKTETVEKIEKLWALVEADAPLDNFNSWAKDFVGAHP
ncbi:hypothetical protein CKM354_000005500 [Cercospora kikuchii]|uniref:NADP-dependent oxidoreductase domain-containing protein n=1 Tax=Cercospora kikuchii TaxID=84275 RepID=A0A9P3FBH4_9PEZI|nr:uncharacterized protein CKM354_000005500 [Cercospora kikuchii]GIZ36585.1 hypothetical protein CKM354_000005500 [Cercospora kikuchii]